MEQDNFLELSNTAIKNKDKQFFEMGLEINAIIKNLATLTIDNWRSVKITNSLVFRIV